MARTVTVLGALGSGGFGPLLAEESWTGGSRRVVLGRPALETAAVVSGCLSDQVVGEQGRIRIDGTEFGVFPYAPAVDVDDLLEASPDGLDSTAVAALREGVLAALESAPVAHGALTSASVRVGSDGRVRLVGFTGREADDRARLEELVREWSGGVDPIPLVQRVRGLETPLLPHALSGRVIVEATAPPVPPKVQTAAFAAVTLILGLLAAWFYIGP